MYLKVHAVEEDNWASDQPRKSVEFHFWLPSTFLKPSDAEGWGNVIARRAEDECRKHGIDYPYHWAISVFHPNGMEVTECGSGYASMYPQSWMELSCSVYRDWLTDKPDDEIVGKAKEGDNCPIQHWLTAQYGEYRWHVYGREIYRLDAFGYPMKLNAPDWVVQFVKIVDVLPYSEYVGDNGVTAAVAESVRERACAIEE